MALNFDWQEEIKCNFTEDTLKADMLDRAKYAEYLTKYLKVYRSKNYVFNINSNWGAGKTYFIKRWADTLKSKHPVIYFNSWKHDNNSEPLILILGEIIERLESLLGNENSKDKKKLKTSTLNALKHIIPTLSKGIFQKVSGTNWNDLLPNEDNPEDPITQGADTQTGTNKIIGELGSSKAKGLLSLHKEQAESIDILKKQIESILEDVLTEDKELWSPMYVFIDELDRCRPTFAIEVLEVIKHIFDIPKIIFVIATDTTQLQHSIKAVYGSGFDAEKYLMRFFNRSFSLPQPKLIDYLKTHKSFKIVTERFIETSDLHIYEIDENKSLELSALIFESFDTDLRTVDQIIERVSSILSNHVSERGVLYLILLEALRAKSRECFELLMSGKIQNQANSKINLNDTLLPLLNDSGRSIIFERHELIEQSSSLIDVFQSSTINDNEKNNRIKTKFSIWSILGC